MARLLLCVIGYDLERAMRRKVTVNALIIATRP